MKTVGGRYFWPLLTTVNKLTVFIWFSKQNTYPKNQVLSFQGSDARPIKINMSCSIYLNGLQSKL